MSDKLDQFIGDIANAGLALRSMDFSTSIELNSTCSNVTAGIDRGQAPRYGMAPLVSQSIDSAVDANGTYGMLGSANSSSARAVYGLYRVFGIQSVPLISQTEIGSTSSPKTTKTYFFACIGVTPDGGTNQYLAWVPLGTSGSSFAWVPKAAVAYGLLRPLVESNTATPSVCAPGNYRMAGVDLAGESTETQFRNLAKINLPSGTIDYCSTAVLAVAGQAIPAQWILGNRVTVGDATTSATSVFTLFGCPNFPIDRKFTQGNRSWALYNISSSVFGTARGLEAEYDFSKTPTYTDLLATADQSFATAHLTATFVTGSATRVDRVDASPPVYSAVGFVLWHDDVNYLNTAHTFLFAAPGKPLAMIVQGWQRNSVQMLEQWTDLRCRALAPGVYNTLNVDDNTTRYTEAVSGATSATPEATSWIAWYPFTEGTALRTLASLAATRATDTVGIALGAANTGILRAKTTYEFTFAIFDKQLGTESNVGVPAKIRTSTDDFIALCIWADMIVGGNYKQRCINSGSSFGAILGSQQPYLRNKYSNSYATLNYTEIRIYYRAFGSFEWLPALFIDAADYFYNPNHKELMACTGNSVGSVGGQPGGFNDYSELPDDTYNCVVVWKQRVFWLSQKSLLFSNANDGFSYPVRNAAQIPQGEYKGATVHNYPGESEQDSRLVVWGTRETYVGKFSGALQQMSVQVDPDNVGTFYVDGSDFVLNSWTSVTAFSYRSACVADGILFFWGPQGVYRDDGVDTPAKISDELEPQIFDLYAKQRTDDIHCTYSEQTKEIIWFYFDNSVYSSYSAAQEQTKLMVYNTQTKEFTFGATSACVDGSQKLNSGAGTLDLVRATGGDRTVIFPRVSKASTGVQQAYFFDYRNRAGDLRYGLERLVSVIATPVAGSRRFTLPNGATGISVGDLISTDQINAYTNDQDSSSVAIVVEDFVGRVTAVNTSGTNYIDVLLPTNIDASFVAAATLGPLNAFPIYVGKTILAANASAGNAFPFNLATQYWCPAGLNYNGFWLYLHLLFKLELLKAEGLDQSFGITLAHRTPDSLEFNEQDLIFGDERRGVWNDTINSDGNQQIYLPLKGTDQMEGQGVKLKFSGLHYAHKWVLQYISAFASPQVYDFLKRYEGVS